MNRLACLAAFVGAAALVAAAEAYTYEYRIVEMVGTTENVLASNTIRVRSGTAHRYRLQVRVVPSGPGDALGGFFAWNVGTITTTGGINSRTGQAPNPFPRGRLSPFTAAPGTSADGLPRVDPFTHLEAIDAAVLVRVFQWDCGPDGLPEPQPVCTPFGRGEFVSVFEITSVATLETYTVTFAGNLIGGSGFNTLVCNPPECGDPQTPGDDEPSTCQYTPVPYPPQPFSLQLTVETRCGDWNGDNAVNSQDVFDFFHDFFANDADVNADGVTNSEDYFTYIIWFLRGCM